MNQYTEMPPAALASVATDPGTHGEFTSRHDRLIKLAGRVSRASGVHLSELTGRSREEAVVAARDKFIETAKALGFSAEDIAKSINRHAGTIRHHLRKSEK